MPTHICVIFPYKPLEEDVFPLLSRLLKEIWTPGGGLYNKKTRPLLVVNRDTVARGTYTNFLEYLKSRSTDLKVSNEEDLKKRMDVLKVWSVDTCQMWLSGFGKVLDDIDEGLSGPADDKSTVLQVPGDLTQIQDFGEFIKALEDMRALVESGSLDFCVGDFEIEPEGSKHLIDVYGTYPLLFNWFPSVALKLREPQRNIKRPRSEFFAVSVSFLKEMLKKRKFAYEQTMAFLIYALHGEEHAVEIPDDDTADKGSGEKTAPKKWGVSSRSIGTVHDYGAERGFREATDQIERTERMLKVMWRELSGRDESRNDFDVEKFALLDQHSTAIREAAMVSLRNLLRAQELLRKRTST